MSGQSVAFDRAAGYYDQTRGFPSGVERDVAALLVRVGGLTRESRVLEVGVGTGRIALPLAPHVGAYYGVDLAQPMIDRLLEKRTNEPVYPIISDITRLPFAPRSFDAAIAVHIFHLVPTYRDALRETARVLKPGGVLLHGWNDTGADDLERIWNETITTLGGSTASAPGAMNRKERKTFLSDNGWILQGQDRFTFSIQRSTAQHLDAVRNRIYSSLWHMPDDIHAAGIAALESFVAEQRIDLSAPQTVESAFVVQVYTPPAE